MADISIEGRKIVFVKPPRWLREELIAALVAQEYKVFYLDDHRLIGTVMRTYPGALIFANKDKAPAGRSWDEVMDEVSEIRDATGSIVSTLSMDEERKSVVSAVQAIVDKHGARGRRRFARTPCLQSGDATLNIRRDRDFHNGVILDISSAGFACQVPSLENYLSLRMRIDDVQLTLANARLKVEATVAAVRNGSPITYVMLFASKLSQANRQKIYTFMRKTSQRNFERSLKA